MPAVSAIDWSTEDALRLSQVLARIETDSLSLPAGLSIITGEAVAGQNHAYGVIFDFSDAHSPSQLNTEVWNTVATFKRRRGMTDEIKDVVADEAGSGSCVLDRNNNVLFHDLQHTIIEVLDVRALPYGAVAVELSLPRQLDDETESPCTMKVQVVDNLPVSADKAIAYYVIFRRKPCAPGALRPAAEGSRVPFSLWGRSVVQSLLGDMNVEMEDRATAYKFVHEDGAPEPRVKAIFSTMLKLEANQPIRYKRTPGRIVALLPGLPRTENAMEIETGM